MRVKEILTWNPAFCTPESSVQDAALLMVKHDCGEISVVESEQSLKPVGVVTDRDIACRVAAAGNSPRETSVSDCMSTPCVTVTPETSVEDCCRVLEQNQIRGVPVVNESGHCCGVVSQADIVKSVSKSEAAEVLRQVSERSEHASRISG